MLKWASFWFTEIIQTTIISLQNQNKEIDYYKVPNHISIKGNEAAGKTVYEVQICQVYTQQRYQEVTNYPIRKYAIRHSSPEP